MMARKKYFIPFITPSTFLRLVHISSAGFETEDANYDPVKQEPNSPRVGNGDLTGVLIDDVFSAGDRSGRARGKLFLGNRNRPC
jgi:hypothetical protein